MKSEHRHQLKTNELAEWIVHFPEWAKENATFIIYVSVVIVLVAGVYFWKVYEKQVIAVRRQLALTSSASQVSYDKTRILRAQAQGMDTAYTLIQTADKLQDVAEEVKNDEMVALALIKEAEALRMELHYRFGNVSRQNLADQINRAKDCYTKALEKSSTDPYLAAAAKFGLGLCEEELGNFGQAREIYEEIVTDPDFKYTVVVPQAQQRLKTMAAYQQKVTFKRAPRQKQPVPEYVRPEINVTLPEDSLETQEPNVISDVPDVNMSG